MDRVEVDGVRVAFRRTGSGPPLLLLHGALADSRDWLQQLDAFATAFTVVAWDAPGCGSSDDLPPADYGLDELTDTLAGFIRTTGLGRPQALDFADPLVGSCFGDAAQVCDDGCEPVAFVRIDAQDGASNTGLDCPFFVTTPEFLGQHRQQLVTTEQLIARARADGHFRMVEVNERVATNLQRIVTALEVQEQATHASCNTRHLTAAAARRRRDTMDRAQRRSGKSATLRAPSRSPSSAGPREYQDAGSTRSRRSFRNWPSLVPLPARPSRLANAPPNGRC